MWHILGFWYKQRIWAIKCIWSTQLLFSLCTFDPLVIPTTRCLLLTFDFSSSAKRQRVSINGQSAIDLVRAGNDQSDVKVFKKKSYVIYKIKRVHMFTQTRKGKRLHGCNVNSNHGGIPHVYTFFSYFFSLLYSLTSHYCALHVWSMVM